MPALFWLNAVFVVATALVIAPSMSAAQPAPMSLGAGFAVSLFMCVVCRLPGAWGEWWLTRRSRHRWVYAVHLGAGLLTVLFAALAALSPPAAGVSSAAIDTAASAVTVYLVLSSLALAISVPIAITATALTRRGHAPGADGQAGSLPFALSLQTTQPITLPQPTASLYPPSGAPPAPQQTYRASVPAPDARHVPAPHARHDQAPHARQAPAPPEPEPANRAEKARSEIAMALGIVVGLASLVQGYDSADPVRTVFLALAFGGLGFLLIYGPTIRR